VSLFSFLRYLAEPQDMHFIFIDGDTWLEDNMVGGMLQDRDTWARVVTDRTGENVKFREAIVYGDIGVDRTISSAAFFLIRLNQQNDAEIKRRYWGLRVLNKLGLSKNKCGELYSMILVLQRDMGTDIAFYRKVELDSSQ
jgi:hypothetical protein